MSKSFIESITPTLQEAIRLYKADNVVYTQDYEGTYTGIAQYLQSFNTQPVLFNTQADYSEASCFLQQTNVGYLAHNNDFYNQVDYSAIGDLEDFHETV